MNDFKTIVNRFFSNDPKAQSAYTRNELNRARDALRHMGYRDETGLIYGTQAQRFSQEFVKRDGMGKVTGVASIFLDKGNKKGMVQDGIVSIAHDENLVNKLGSTTTVRDVANKLNPKITGPRFF